MESTESMESMESPGLQRIKLVILSMPPEEMPPEEMPKEEKIATAEIPVAPKKKLGRPCIERTPEYLEQRRIKRLAYERLYMATHPEQRRKKVDRYMFRYYSDPKVKENANERSRRYGQRARDAYRLYLQHKDMIDSLVINKVESE